MAPIPAATIVSDANGHIAFVSLLITTLPKGPHTLTAVFTPTNPGAFAPSTSAPVSRTVSSLFS
ncbi:MAG: hypothetical protein ACRDTX_28350 [Pseudonocardiaceae bacterium]